MTEYRYSAKPLVIKDLLPDALKRHGISKQVTSTIIIKSTDELLNCHLPDCAKNDVKALSYKNENLYIACRHPAAMFIAEKLKTKLHEQLLKRFPDITFNKISFCLNTQPWENFD